MSLLNTEILVFINGKKPRVRHSMKWLPVHRDDSGMIYWDAGCGLAHIAPARQHRGYSSCCASMLRDVWHAKQPPAQPVGN